MPNHRLFYSSCYVATCAFVGQRNLPCFWTTKARKREGPQSNFYLLRDTK